MSEAFISYSRKDLDFVRKLSESLKRDLEEVWVDLEGLFAGEQWWSRVCSEIDAANVFIFVASKNSEASVPCHRESQYAAANNKRILPIVINDVAVDALPESIRSRHWIDFWEARQFLQPAARLPLPPDRCPQMSPHLFIGPKKWESL